MDGAVTRKPKMAAVGVALAASGFVLDAPGVTWVRKVKPTRRYVQGRLDSLLWWRVYIGMVARTGQKLLKIGEVARLTGFSVKALHYCEERRLIAPAERCRRQGTVSTVRRRLRGSSSSRRRSSWGSP